MMLQKILQYGSREARRGVDGQASVYDMLGSEGWLGSFLFLYQFIFIVKTD